MDFRKRSDWTVRLLYLQIAISVVAIISGTMEWFFFIVTTLSGNAAFRGSLRADEIGELLAVNLVTRTSDFVDIPLAIVLMVIVRRIHDNQELARSTATVPEPQNAAGVTA
jgi:hypothetical protein